MTGVQTCALPIFNSALTMGEGILKNYDDNANTLTLYIDSNSVQTVVRDTHSNFVADTTTIYDEGVLLYETDTQKFKFGNGVDIFTNLYFAALSTLGGSMQANIDMQENKIIHLGAPTDTYDAVNRDYVDTTLDTHNQTHIDVHGIANTFDLATKTYADDSAIASSTSAVSTHNELTTNVHGIWDTSLLATADDLNT